MSDFSIHFIIFTCIVKLTKMVFLTSYYFVLCDTLSSRVCGLFLCKSIKGCEWIAKAV